MENRLKDAVQRIDDRERSLASEFGLPAKLLKSDAFRKEKLKDYEQVLKKKWGGLSREEKLYRKFLHQKCNEMERELHKNGFIRIWVNLVKLGSAIMTAVKSPVSDRPVLQTGILQKSGFADIEQKAQSLAKKGIDDFVVPVSRSMSAKDQVEFNLSFARDGNHLVPKQVTASLFVDGEAGPKTIAVGFEKDGKALNQQQLYNLLSGRFVKQGDNWLRVDFNDGDPKGNSMVKEFTAVGFDLRQELKKLPGWDKIGGMSMGKIIEGLENGDRVKLPFSDDQNGSFTLMQVNPLKRQLEHYDQQGNYLSDERQNFSRQLELLFNKGESEHVSERNARVRKAI